MMDERRDYRGRDGLLRCGVCAAKVGEAHSVQGCVRVGVMKGGK